MVTTEIEIKNDNPNCMPPISIRISQQNQSLMPLKIIPSLHPIEKNVKRLVPKRPRPDTFPVPSCSYSSQERENKAKEKTGKKKKVLEKPISRDSFVTIDISACSTPPKSERISDNEYPSPIKRPCTTKRRNILDSDEE